MRWRKISAQTRLIKIFDVIIKIFALKNFKINIHQNVSRAFNILHYKQDLEEQGGGMHHSYRLYATTR